MVYITQRNIVVTTPQDPDAEWVTASAAIPSRMPPSLPHGKRVTVGVILFVEGNDIQRAMVSVRLTDVGHRVQAVGTGRQALELVEAGDAPEVVVLNVGLPDMTGFELLPRLRARPGCDRMPAVFLTAHDRSTEIVVGLQLRAAYVIKPLIMSALIHAVHNALRVPGADYG